MAPKKRKSDQSDTVYASRPILKQARFSSPRRRTTRSYATPSTVSRKQQQTLTQIRFPIFLDHSDHDGASVGSQESDGSSTAEAVKEDAEETGSDDDKWVELGSRTKRRRVQAQSRGSIASRTPKNRCLGKEIRQQTLTQAGYLLRHNQYWCSEDERDDGVGVYDEPEAAANAVNRAAGKRRKRGSEELGRGEDDVVAVTNVDQLKEHAPTYTSAKEQRGSTTKLSPRTPKRRRRFEVPSSQSPADTPLSTQSTRLSQSPARSPLKDCSGNTPMPPPQRKLTTSKNPKDPFAKDNDGGLESVTLPNTLSAATHKSFNGRLRRTGTIQDSDNEYDENEFRPRAYEPSGLSNESVHINNEATYDQWNNDANLHSTVPAHPDWKRLDQREVTQFTSTTRQHAPFVADTHKDASELLQISQLSAWSGTDDPSAQLLRNFQESAQSQNPMKVSGPSVPPVPEQRTADIPQASPQARGYPRERNKGSPEEPRPLEFPSVQRQSSPGLQSSVGASSSPIKVKNMTNPSSPTLGHPPKQKQGHSRTENGSAHYSSVQRVTFSQLVPESLRNYSFPLPPEWTDEEEL